MMNRSYLEVAALAIVAAASIAWILKKFQRSYNPKRDAHRRSLEGLQEAKWEKGGKIKSLCLYPVKSCAPIGVQKVLAEKNGFQLGKCRDRCFVIIDEKREMITARKVSSTLFINPEIDDECNSITLTFPELEPLIISLTSVELEGDVGEAYVWGLPMPGFDCGDKAADWLTAALKRKCRLIYYGSGKSNRPTVSSREDHPLVNDDDTIIFADSDAFLLINETSVFDLEKRTGRQHPVENFRGNMVVECSSAYAEDDWTYLKIGSAVFRRTKPCARCIFPTIHFKTGIRDPYMEPLKTLKRYRCPSGSKNPDFGIFLAVEKVGQVRVGETFYVLRD